MPSTVADLLDELQNRPQTDVRPWGFMRVLDAPDCNLTVKYLTVHFRSRTSRQRHERKDELLFILGGEGYVEVLGLRHRGAGMLVRIKPGMPHRVHGPLTYLEISSYDDGTDTIRLEDDYGRA